MFITLDPWATQNSTSIDPRQICDTSICVFTENLIYARNFFNPSQFVRLLEIQSE